MTEEKKQTTVPTPEETAKKTAEVSTGTSTEFKADNAVDTVSTGDKKEEKKSAGKSDNRGSRGGGRGRDRGRAPREPKEFEESIIEIRRVTRVTRGGRQLRFQVVMVIGDKKGRIGFATGKASEVMIGAQKAVAQAKKNLITVPIFQDTIPHPVTADFKATKVILLPAPEGTGIVAGSATRKILELAGIKNVLSKIHKSRNKLNVVHATLKALKGLQNRTPISSESAEESGDDTTIEKTAERKAPKKSETKKRESKPTAKKATAKKTTIKKPVPKR